METIPSNQQMKQLFKAAIIEVLSERKDLLIEIVREALEDVALGKAIEEGITNEPVAREEVFKVFAKIDEYETDL